MNRFLSSVAAGLLGLAATGTAQAQHGHGHGGHGSHGFGHAGHGFGHGGHGWGGHGYFYGHGLYYPGHHYYYPSYGYGYYYPRRYFSAYPGYAGYYDSPNYGGYYQSYYGPASSARSGQAADLAVAGSHAGIQVRLPDSEAEVLFDGEPTSSTGRVRLYEPPKLEPGKSYVYKVTARWNEGGRPVTDMRKVTVSAGQVSVVDFTRPASSERVAPPAQGESPEQKNGDQKHDAHD